MVPTRTQYSLTQRQPVAGDQAADASRRRPINRPHSGHGMPTAHGRSACGHTSRKRRPTRAPQCSRGAAHPRAPWRVRETTTPSPPHIHRRHAPPRDRARASLRHRDDVSTSAPMPPPARSAAAEPPVARAMQLHGLPVPATQRETTRNWFAHLRHMSQHTRHASQLCAKRSEKTWLDLRMCDDVTVEGRYFMLRARSRADKLPVMTFATSARKGDGA